VRLHGETEAAARERYKHYLQLALSAIHSGAYFYMAKRPLATHGDWALRSQPAPIPLPVEGGGSLYLTATHSFRMRQDKRDWRVSTQEYIYNISDREDTRDYMFAWHWHPNQWPECHMHVNAELSNGMKLDRKHIPTTRISLEVALRFLVTDCGVVPAKPDWQKTLDHTQRLHEQYRTWRGSKKP
jgi:hypothetical protein